MQTSDWFRWDKNPNPAELRSTWAFAAGGAVLYGLLAYGAIELTRGDGRIAAVWLPNALAVAFLLRWSLPREPIVLAGLFAGNCIASAAIGDPALTVIGLATANLVEIVLAVALMRRFAGDPADMTAMSDLLKFVGLAGIVAPAASATLAMIVLGDGQAAFAAFSLVLWTDWFVADGLGMIIFAPATMIFIDAARNAHRPSRQLLAEWIALTVGGTCVTIAVFWQTEYPLLFLVAPVVLLHAFRLGSLGTAFSVIKVAAVATVLTWMGRGPINLMEHSFASDVIVLQVFLASAFFMGLPVAAVLNDQRRMAEDHRDRALQLRLLAENITDAVLRYDAGGVCTYASPSVTEVLGMQPGEFIGRKPSNRTHPEASDAITDAEARLVGGESEKERFTYRRFLDDSAGDPVYIEADAALAYDSKTGEREGIIVSARNVTHRVLLERQLIRARRHAENAAIAKAQFLANMSHEIRTPMNGVLGFAELLLQSDLQGEQRRHAELIEESGKSMMRLLNDILDISKIEAGHIVIQQETVDLPHLLESCIKLHSAHAAQKGLQLAHECAPEVPQNMVCDPLRLRQIVLNLLGNAIKFTDAGKVSLEAYCEGSEMAIAVEDSGIGIAADRLDSVFQPFEQADNATSRRYGGTGLGLAISRQLAELLGGSLDANSEVGRGSRFLLRIPMQLPEASSAAATSGDVKPLPQDMPPPARILLAEDHDINRILVTTMLERCGQQVETVGDGNQAVAAAINAAQEGKPFDLVLMDVQMPHCDGYAATRALRMAGIGAAQLPIVALTANAFEEDVKAAEEAGMQGHLAKPLVFDDLVKALARWLPTRIVEEPRQAACPPRPPSVDRDMLARKWKERRSEALMAVSDALRRGGLVGADAEELARLVHKLAGTAGMFGEDELGKRASAFERALRTEEPREVCEALAEDLLKAA